MKRGDKKKWTQQEIDFLKENYGKIFAWNIAKKMGRTQRSIQCEASRLNLKSDLFDHSHVSKNNTKFHLKKLLTSSYQMSPELAYVLGVMLGDGTLSNQNTVRLQAIDKDFVVNFHNKLEKWSGMKVCKIYETLNGKNRHNLWNALLNSREANRTLKRFLLDIDRIMLNAPRKCKIAFLEGLYDSEGSVSITSYKNKIVRFCNCNKQLIDLMIEIFKMLGIEKIRINCRILPSGKEFFEPVISMRIRIRRGERPEFNQDFEKFKQLIHFSIARKQDRLEMEGV